MALDDTQLNIAELIERSILLERRLHRNMDALDAGDVSAAQDVAGLARTLLANGDGDKVIRRLCSALSIPLPQFWVTHRPDHHDFTQISLGRLPLDYGVSAVAAAALRPPPEVVSFETLLEETALVCEGTDRRTYSWSRLATEIGNTWGSHLSKSVPSVLRQIDFLEINGMTFADFVVRQMGWFAEEALRQVLPHAGVKYEPHERRTTFVGNIELSHLILQRKPSLFGAPNSRGVIATRLRYVEPVFTRVLRFEDRGRIRTMGIMNGGELFYEDVPLP